MKKNIKTITTAVFIAAVFVGCSNNSKSGNAETNHEHDHAAAKIKADTAVIEANQSVFFDGLKEGDVLNSPVIVKFGVKGMEVEPMNAEAPKNKGHHHLMIDTIQFVPAGEIVPSAENRIIHFGKGQKETKIELKKGKHLLSLQFADGMHRSYGVKMSKTIRVEVK